MQYLGGKLSSAQLQVAGLVGGVRRSLQGALELVWGTEEKKQEEEDEDRKEEEGGNRDGRFQRAILPLRSFARRSRRSLRRFSTRSRQTLQRRSTETYPAQADRYCADEDKDTDALIDSEPELHNGPRVQTPEPDSPKPDLDQIPEVASEGVDTTDFEREPEMSPFPESSTPLLDNSAQRSKAHLSRRRGRTRPPRSLRGVAQTGIQDWRTCDSTDDKQRECEKEEEEEEEQSKPKTVRSPLPSSQRVPIFPGLSPANLIAQLKRRTGGGGNGGGGEEAEEDKHGEETESPNGEAAPLPTQLSRSPRSASHLAGAARVLPPIGGTDGSATSSPAWLKELKSKKRLSQHEGE